MPDIENVIKGLNDIGGFIAGRVGFEQARNFLRTIHDTIELLKEQEKLVDVDALREKLGFAKDCAKCKQNTRACQYDSHFSLMDFCERLDMAIEELM